jgi:CRP-like cAMP-binding protein
MAQIDQHVKDVLQSLVPNTPVDNWDEMENVLTKRVVKKGEHFFQHFDKCEEVAIISKGLFRIYLIDNDGEEKTFSFIPEYGFILDFFLTWDATPSMISVQAIEDSEIYATNYKTFIDIIKKNPTWAAIYREILIKTYMVKTKREIEFVLYNAKERLKKAMDSKDLDVNRIPKSYLASYLGIAPPSLSRLLRELKEA